MFIAWVKKKLKIKAPSDVFTEWGKRGYTYEYDYLKDLKRGITKEPLF